MFNLLAHPMWFILTVSATLAFILALVNKMLVDQDRMKEINDKVRNYNKKMMKATREKNTEEIERLNKDKDKIMGFQQEMMKMQMPMFASMLPFFVVFWLLRRVAEGQAWGAFIELPFTLNFLNIGSSLTWLGWYVTASLPFSALFRKALGVR